MIPFLQADGKTVVTHVLGCDVSLRSGGQGSYSKVRIQLSEKLILSEGVSLI